MNYKKLMEETNIVYNTLGDDISRNIYENRVMYSLTNDYKYIKNIVIDNLEYKKLKNIMDKNIKDNKKMFIYGAGIWGEYIYNCFSEIKWTAFVDKNKNGFFLNLPIIKVDEINIDLNSVFVISSRIYHNEIYNELLQKGVNKENIIDIGNILEQMEENQYFDILPFDTNTKHVFVDVGAYDCKNTLSFIKWCKNNYSKIIAIEPDKKNFLNCQNEIIQKNIKDIELLNLGLWDKKETLKFNSNSSIISNISNEGEIILQVDALDNIAKNDLQVTFIKMDIEGAELNALIGSRNTIVKNKPILAISIYHKKKDIFEIINYILSLNLNYKFYLRHYSLGKSETILYAIV